MTTTRRSFLIRSSATAGLTALGSRALLGKTESPNARITVAGIGLGPRGRKVLRAFLAQTDVQFVAIADVQEVNREIIRKTVNRHYGNEDCKAYSNMQDIFDRDDIDAVLIATGDRWHATASILAARAGKDVYCEKPCSMSISEARELDEEILKHKRIYQGGMQRRNVGNFQLAAELVHTGKLGKITQLDAGIQMPKLPNSPLPGQPEPDPKVCNWDAWCGPAPKKPYNLQYVRGRWRGHDGYYAAWGLHEWASHTVNLCQWAAKMDHTTPVEYWFENDQLCGLYANGMKVVMRKAGFKKEGTWLGLGSCPIRFIGENGWVEAGDLGKIAYSDDSLAGGKTPAEMPGIDPAKHVREFVDSVKSRKPTACNSSVTRTTEIACHAAGISWKLGRKLKFDPAQEKFIGDDEANSMLSYERRAPYTI